MSCDRNSETDMKEIYSVIIQTTETAEENSAYKTLFLNDMAKEKTGFCIWNTDGRDIDSALPDLLELTDDKKEWNAVVVLSEEDIRKFGAKPNMQNPFDFSMISGQEDSLEMSGNPLVRLTHMLGGVPAPESEFKSVVVDEEGKQPHIVYKPVKDKEKEKKYRQLQENYFYDGVSPSKIFLVTLRQPWIGKSELSNYWIDNYESMSSEFWKRNRYPANCRFVVFDTVRQGPTRKEEDLFKYWLMILMICCNDINPASIQAYRLYHGDIELDERQLEDSFQDTVNRLSSVKRVLKKSISRDFTDIYKTSTKLPAFRTDIPVVFDVPDNQHQNIETRYFKIATSGRGRDVKLLDSEREKTKESLEECVKTADRALDKTASLTKSTYKYDEREVERLDQYQKEDLQSATDRLYKRVIGLQSELPDRNVTENEEAVGRSESIRRFLKRRVSTRQVFGTLLLGFIAILAAVFPAFISSANVDPVSPERTVAISASLFITVLLTIVITLIVYKLILNKKIKNLNDMTRQSFDRVLTNTELYSDYLNAVASHSRGKTYLELAKDKEAEIVRLHELYYKHISVVDAMMARVKDWSNAFHLNVDFERPLYSDVVEMNVMTDPSSNNLYSLESKRYRDTELNNSGMHIESPFPFVKRMNLDREELYDNE